MLLAAIAGVLVLAAPASASALTFTADPTTGGVGTRIAVQSVDPCPVDPFTGDRPVIVHFKLRTATGGSTLAQLGDLPVNADGSWSGTTTLQDPEGKVVPGSYKLVATCGNTGFDYDGVPFTIPQHSFSVDVNSGAVGTVIAVQSVEPCPGATSVRFSLTSIVDGNTLPSAFDESGVSLSADGSWGGTIRLIGEPDLSSFAPRPGLFSLDATCSPTGIAYTPVSFTVTPSTFSASPTTVQEGKQLTVRSIDPCPPAATNFVELDLSPASDPAQSQRLATPSVDASGSWSGTFTIAVAGGDYSVDAQCVNASNFVDVTYASVPLHVTVGEFTVSPTSGPPGTQITVRSVDPCFAREVNLRLQGGILLPDPAQVVPNPDGSWSGTFTIGPDILPEGYTVTATCNGFPYTGVPFTVTPPPDTSPPAVAISLTSPNGGVPDGQGGWFVTGPVTGSVSADDTRSGASNIASLDCGSLGLTRSGLGTPKASGTFSIAAEGVTHISCTVTDSAGNASDPVTKDAMLDTHAPTVSRNTDTDSCSQTGNSGWCRGTQTGGFTATDAISGVASPCTGGACNFIRSTSAEGSAVSIGSGQVCDVAGNCSDGIAAGPFQIDHTPPTLSPAISPQPVLLHGTATAAANASDGVSGVSTQGCDPVDTRTGGTHTLTCTATDNAGNAATASVSYVVAYKLLGFFSPVPNSKWKQGQTVPVKVALADANGTRISDTEAQGLLSPTCRVTFIAMGAQATSACTRYDTANHQFLYNWQLGTKTGNDTITVTVSYPGTTATTSLSDQITIGT